ncbi:hypothetical protein [Staphylococcus hominis]|uniref:hypothetical protein n=2 Tax=Staphylococcus TaxID=1279 RepID=UPI003204E715
MTNESELLNNEYLEEYGLSKEEIDSNYKKILNESVGDPKKISTLFLSSRISSKYETPFYVNHSINLLSVFMFQYIEETEDKKSFKDYNRKTERLFRILDKRISDWIIRQSQGVEYIQESIIRVFENEFDLDRDTFLYVGGLLTLSMTRYKESELDLISIKAARDYLPLFELDLLIKKYQKDIKNVCKKWNDINQKLKEKTDQNIGVFNLEELDISEKLYKKNFKVFKDYNTFPKELDKYSASFIESEEIEKNIFLKGGDFNASTK